MNGKNRAGELFERFVSGGEATIDQFIAQKVSEELFIDYKRVTNQDASVLLEQADRENLARAVSGFANSEGGVIIWGVDCRNDPQRSDVPTTKHPIQNVKRFVELPGRRSFGLHNSVARWRSPSHYRAGRI